MSDLAINIRLATEQDCAAMLAIYAPFIINTTTSFEVVLPTVEEFWHRVQKTQELHAWLICEWNGQVVGYAYGGKHRSREAYQWSTEVSVYIHPDFHKRNIATALYRALIDILQLQGYRNFLAGVTLPNPPSLAFHQNFGFKVIGNYEKVGYKFGAWRDTCWLQLFLGAETEAPKPLQTLDAIKDLGAFKKALRQAEQLINVS